MDPEQIRSGFNLACGMSQECRLDIFGGESASVVRNTEHGDSSLLRFHRNAGSAGIQCIFHQLLYDRGRAFDHFPAAIWLTVSLSKT